MLYDTEVVTSHAGTRLAGERQAPWALIGRRILPDEQKYVLYYSILGHLDSWIETETADSARGCQESREHYPIADGSRNMMKIKNESDES